MSFDDDAILTVAPTLVASVDDSIVADDDAMSYLTPHIAIIYVPKVAAVLSMVGSYCIIREVTGDMQRNQSTVVSRVLLNICVADILFSFGWFLTTWPAPEELPYLRDTNHGTVGTCTAQGVMLELGGAASGYFYAFLAVCYLLIVKHNFRESRLQIVEKWGTSLCWLVSLLGALIPLFLGMYNFSWYVCWIQAHPLGCSETWQVGEEEADCERGDNAFLYAIIVQIIPRWICFFTCVIAMALIFRATRQLEARNASHRGSSMIMNVTSTRNLSSTVFGVDRPVVPQVLRVNRKRSNAVAVQGMLYCCALFITLISDLVSFALSSGFGIWNEYFDIIAYFFTPLAGFLNFLIFIRTRKMRTPEGHFLQSALFAVYRPIQRCLSALASSISCCCSQTLQLSSSASSSETTPPVLNNRRTLSSGSTSKADRVIATSDWILDSRDFLVDDASSDPTVHFNGSSSVLPNDSGVMQEVSSAQIVQDAEDPASAGSTSTGAADDTQGQSNDDMAETTQIQDPEVPTTSIPSEELPNGDVSAAHLPNDNISAVQVLSPEDMAAPHPIGEEEESTAAKPPEDDSSDASGDELV